LLLFGEIAIDSSGTAISVKGNVIIRSLPQVRYINDDTRVKNTIALAQPSGVMAGVSIGWNNQIAELTNVCEKDEMKDGSTNVDHHQWLRSSRSSGSPKDLIVVHMEPSYEVPKTAATSSVSQPQKRSLDDLDAASAAAQPSLVVTDTNVLHYPTDDEIFPGAYYDPRLLPDYGLGGDLFKHQLARLVQQNVRGKNNHIVPPWKYYDELRPGTLILILATFHIYCFAAKQGRAKEHHYYQICARSIRVMGESDTPVEARYPPIVPSSVPSTLSIANSRTAADDAFANFGPSKKFKTTKNADASSSRRTHQTTSVEDVMQL